MSLSEPSFFSSGVSYESFFTFLSLCSIFLPPLNWGWILLNRYQGCFGMSIIGNKKTPSPMLNLLWSGTSKRKGGEGVTLRLIIREKGVKQNMPHCSSFRVGKKRDAPQERNLRGIANEKGLEVMGIYIPCLFIIRIKEICQEKNTTLWHIWCG